MLLKLGIVVVAVVVVAIVLNSLLEVIISIIMIGTGVFVLAALGVIIFSSTEKLDDYRKYFQLKMKKLEQKSRIKPVE